MYREPHALNEIDVIEFRLDTLEAHIKSAQKELYAEVGDPDPSRIHALEAEVGNLKKSVRALEKSLVQRITNLETLRTHLDAPPSTDAARQVRGQERRRPHRQIRPGARRRFCPSTRDAREGREAVMIQPITSPTWQDGRLSFGERAIAWSAAELAKGVCDDPPGSHTSPRIREYLAPCWRDGVGLLHLTAGNWCAAAACAATTSARLPNESTIGIGQGAFYRASGLELQLDARRLGYWLPRDIVYEDLLHMKLNSVLGGVLRIGDLVILQRGNPADGSTAWMRHVCRLMAIHPTTGDFTTIGGNEGGHWQVTDRNLKDRDLLGFIVSSSLLNVPGMLTEHQEALARAEGEVQ